MDPITQGVVGAAVTQTAVNKRELAKAALVGAIGGMAPDLDVFIRSSTDPLLALEFHRHFTHAFAFIPVGGLLCALVLYPLFSRWSKTPFYKLYAWATLGYATHALLDVCTSYGTQVFWPFSNYRMSIDIISVIDPLFTIPLLVCTVLAVVLKSKHSLSIGLVWAACYLSFGAYQHSRAIQAGQALANSRGHEVLRLHAKPSFANLFVWKTIYEAKNTFYVDAVRVVLGGTKVWEGEARPKLNIETDLSWVDIESQYAKDLERFSWFSDGYVALDESNPNRVVDIRYSLLPNEIKALWGIELNSEAALDEHVVYFSSHERAAESSEKLMNMIFNAQK